MTSTPLSAEPQRRSSGPGQVVVHVFGKTDVGRTREHNEDAFVVADLTTGNATLHPEVRTHTVGERGTLFMVADGMGGAAAGEIASAMAVDCVIRVLSENWATGDKKDRGTFASAIKEATERANQEIYRYAADHPEHRGLGTTATVAGLLGDTLLLAQVGDSRGYLVRAGAAKQITKDQSLMQKLIEAGEITPEEAEQSERRNIILQALGPEQKVKIDLTHQQVRRGDVLVLCSDGLSGQVRGDEIAKIVREETDLMQVCKRLIDSANENGGPDNITVIAARFEGDGLLPPDAEDHVGHQKFALGEDTPTSPMEKWTPRRTNAPTVPVDGDAVSQQMVAEQPRPATRQIAPAIRREREKRARMYVMVITAIGVLAVALLAWRHFGK